MYRLPFRSHSEQRVLLAACARSRPAPAAHLGRRRDRDRPVGFADVAALPDPDWADATPGRYTVGGLVPGGRVASVPLTVDPERALVAAFEALAELLDMPLPGTHWESELAASLPARVAQPETEPLADWERELLALPVGEVSPVVQSALAEESLTQDAEDAWCAEQSVLDARAAIWSDVMFSDIESGS